LFLFLTKPRAIKKLN